MNYPDGKLSMTLLSQKFVALPGTAIDTNRGWVGLRLMHDLFTREHNRICDMLKERYHGMADQELFDKARLINAAVMAKIHTVEWTLAVLSSPLLKTGMQTNWWGIKGDFGWLGRLLGKWFKDRSIGYILNGLPGAQKELDGVPFSMTEEFATVYHLHTMLPDTLHINNYASEKRNGKNYDLADLASNESFPIINHEGIDNMLYTFGVEYAGAITLNNYPNALRAIPMVTPTGSSKVLYFYNSKLKTVVSESAKHNCCSAFRQSYILPSFQDLVLLM